MKHTFSVWVENKFGVLARIANLFAARGYNIESLSVAETTDPTLSRMTIIVEGDEHILEQIKKQLNKMIDVVKVSDLTEKPHVERELIFMKVQFPPQKRLEILEMINATGAKVVDLSQKNVTLQFVGTPEEISNLVNIFKPYGIREIARTGPVAIVRG